MQSENDISVDFTISDEENLLLFLQSISTLISLQITTCNYRGDIFKRLSLISGEIFSIIECLKK